MATSKDQVRDQMQQQRNALSSEQRRAAAERMCGLLMAAPFMADVRHVFCYTSIADEIATLELIRRMIDRGLTVSVPMIVGHGVMHAHYIRSVDDLVPGKFNILSPPTPNPVDTVPQVTCCPGCAFTERGDRVGSGYGYYDRYLNTHPDTTPVGLCYDFQVVPTLPVTDADRAMRHVVTDRRVIDCP